MGSMLYVHFLWPHPLGYIFEHLSIETSEQTSAWKENWQSLPNCCFLLFSGPLMHFTTTPIWSGKENWSSVPPFPFKNGNLLILKRPAVFRGNLNSSTCASAYMHTPEFGWMPSGARDVNLSIHTRTSSLGTSIWPSSSLRPSLRSVQRVSALILPSSLFIRKSYVHYMLGIPHMDEGEILPERQH